jgi:drug/metabolite transporter (DMT)-like permease
MVIAAFFAIYIFWGSTYLAIKYAIETMPPFIMAGTRFLFAGGLLFVASMWTKDFEWPSWRHWRTSLIVGTLLLLGGNGGVVFAEKYISSGLAALLIAAEPFWIVVLSWLWLKRGRPGRPVILGLVVGFIGVALLVAGQSGGDSGQNSYYQTLATISVLLAGVAWAVGSLYGIKGAAPKSAILTSGMQMLSGGAVLMLAGSIRGEWSTFAVANVSTNSWLGLGYLIVFGSLIGFTAYSWLLKNAQPSMVATYAYVNPVIAVVLGWLIASETITGQMLIGAGLVVASVVLVTMQNNPKKADEHRDIGMSIEPSRASA